MEKKGLMVTRVLPAIKALLVTRVYPVTKGLAVTREPLVIKVPLETKV